MKLIAQPSVILFNCKIPDLLRETFLTATAIAIFGDRIVALGRDEEIRSFAGEKTNVIDGKGGTLLPGIMDSHTHFMGYVSRKLQVDLSDCLSLSEALERVRQRVEKTPPGEWILGGGWDKNVWGLEDFPDKTLLDKISTRHLIALNSKDWHTLWVNSPVLGECGITENTPNPPGGMIRRYANSKEPTGILHEEARQPIFAQIPPPSLERLRPFIMEAFAEFHRKGITGIHCMETPHEFTIYQDLKRSGNLGLRVFFYFPVRFLAQLRSLGITAGMGDDFLKICGVKIFTDGALGSQTAAMLENYEGLNQNGISTLSEAELNEYVQESVFSGLACAIHAIGDRANRMSLQTLGRQVKESRKRGLRHRIEHAQLLTESDLKLFAQLGIIASVQPIHLSADIPLIRKYWGNRGRWAYAFKSLLKSGAVVAFGSDTPIEDFDPWQAIYAALKRKYLNDPREPSFYSEEEINLWDAFRAYTVNSAFAVAEEHRLGEVKAGKKADLILLDGDIFSKPPEEIRNCPVKLTILNGQVVFRRQDV